MSSTDSDNSTDEPRSGLRDIIVDVWTGRRLALAAVVVCLIAYAIWRVTPAAIYVASRLEGVAVTVILGAVVAYLAAPIVDRMCRVRPFAGSRPGRVAAALIVLVVLGGMLWGLVVMTADPLVRETARLTVLLGDWLKESPEKLDEALAAYAAAVPPEVATIINERATEIANSILTVTSNVAKSVVLHVWWIVEAFLVPVLAFYFITDSEGLLKGTLDLVPQNYRERGAALLKDINETFHSYVRGQLILCVLAAVITAITLQLLGVKAFLTLGLLAGLSRAIPVIGTIVSGIVITAITWIQLDLRAAGIALLVVSIMHFVESKIIMPKVLGHHAALHPVIVVVALLAGAEFFGIMGMFVAVPIVAALRVAVLHWRSWSGDEKAAPA